MADYYEILGITSSADSAAIRAAYKRMAMLYHPDHNQGNKEAEEKFKAVNEAYQVLSDPLKRSRYDARGYGYAYQTVETNQYWRAVQRERYQRWKNVQHTRYRFDAQYFKIQGLAFLVFLIIASFCFGVIHTINYFIAMHYEAIYKQNTVLLRQVDTLFTTGKVDEAFRLIGMLREKEPREFRFLFARDSLVNVLRRNGDENFYREDYHKAGYYYELLKKYEIPQRVETLRRAAICEYNDGNYPDALQTLKHLHLQQPWNLELVYRIGMINLDNLDNKTEALHYFSLGKKLFRENLTKVYGEAYEVVMNPADAPDIYFEIFKGRARANLALKNFSEAETDCNWAIFLRPNHAEPYHLRATAKIKARNFRGLCSDLDNAQRLGARGIAPLRERYCF